MCVCCVCVRACVCVRGKIGGWNGRTARGGKPGLAVTLVENGVRTLVKHARWVKGVKHRVDLAQPHCLFQTLQPDGIKGRRAVAQFAGAPLLPSDVDSMRLDVRSQRSRSRRWRRRCVGCHKVRTTPPVRLMHRLPLKQSPSSLLQ